MKKTKKNSVWGTRMSKAVSSILQKANSSIEIDKRLFQEDIEGSIAHCSMLAKQKIIDIPKSKKIIAGLKKINKEILDNKFQFEIKHEDIHLNIEKRLFAIIGPDAGFLHTARSRNDQVTTDFKLWIKKSSKEIKKLIHDLIKNFTNLAEKNIDIIMPGFTHLKNAQPVLFSHYLLAYVEMFKRDYVKFQNVINNANENPLGAGALAGTSYNIDRHLTSKLLGFKNPTHNSIDSVSDRDYAIEFLFASSLCAMHLSRLAEEIILWNSDLVNFISIEDSLLTGSSMMPQKKNPDSAELIRGKTGSIFGNLNSLLITMKGLPLSYFKDMQEDKAAVFNAYDNLILNLQLANELIKGIKPNKEKLFNAALEGYTTATDFADYLVKKGISFREAYKKSAELVNIAEKNKLRLDQLDFTTVQKIHKSIEPDVMKVFKIENSIEKKISYGGTGTKNVINMIKKIKKEFK
jgi:argininosuccinate lyase